MKNIRTPIFLLIVLSLIFCSSTFCQININYVPDWPSLFLSNTNLISDDDFYGNNFQRLASIEENLFNSGFVFNNFYKEKKDDNIYRSVFLLKHRNDFYIPLKVFPIPVVMGLHSKIVQKELNYDFIKTQSLRLKNNSDTYSFYMLGSLWKDYLYMMGKMGRTVYGNEKYYPWSIGFQFIPIPEFLFRYQRNSHYFKWNNSLHYVDSPIQFEQPEDIQTEEYELTLKIIPRCNITAFVRNSNINKDYKRPQENTILFLEGYNYNRKYSVEILPLDSMRFNVNYNYSSTNTPGRLYHWGSYAGQMTAWNFFSETFNVGYSYSNDNSKYSTDFSWGKRYSRQRLHRLNVGYFTSVWVTLLGKFYSINSRLKYRFERYTFSYRFKQRTWQGEVLAAFERIYPWGRIKTTEIDIIIPVGGALYIPKKSSQDGFYLGLSLKKNFGKNIQLSYQGSQYIPANLKVGKTSDSQENRKSSVYGGGQHVLQFSFLF